MRHAISSLFEPFQTAPRLNRMQFLGLYLGWFSIGLAVVFLMMFAPPKLFGPHQHADKIAFVTGFVLVGLVLVNLVLLTTRRLRDMNLPVWWLAVLIPLLPSLFLLPGCKSFNRYREFPSATLRHHYILMVSPLILLFFILFLGLFTGTDFFV